MNQLSVALTSYEKKDKKTARPRQYLAYATPKPNSSERQYLFCDLYCTLSVIDQTAPYMALYINDEFYRVSAKGVFDIDPGILVQYYGFISFTVALGESADTAVFYQTPPFECCFVSNNNRQLLQSIENMIFYIVEHNRIIYTDVAHTTMQRELTFGLKPNESHTFTVLNDTLQLYKNYYSAFMNKPHKTSSDQARLVDFEKVTYLSRDALVNIATNPEFLQRCSFPSNIEFNGDYYLPQKVVSLAPVDQLCNFENQVTMDFLKTIIDFLQQQRQKIQQLETDMPSSTISPSYFSIRILLERRNRLNLIKHKDVVNRLLQEFSILQRNYARLFSFPAHPLTVQPRCSRVFENVMQYRAIYQQIKLWFGINKNLFISETINLHIAKSSLLYEHYLLLKQYQHLLATGWRCVDKKVVQYEISQSALYKNLPYYNRFTFEKANRTKVLFYQPVINQSSWKQGLGLYRSISFPQEFVDEKNPPYYAPDYVIKETTPDQADRYTVLDAKFSSHRTIVDNQLHHLAFKYIQSIDLINSEDRYANLVILCGKGFASTQHITADLSHPKGSPTKPTTGILIGTINPLAEGTPNDHTALLENCL